MIGDNKKSRQRCVQRKSLSGGRGGFMPFGSTSGVIDALPNPLTSIGTVRSAAGSTRVGTRRIESRNRFSNVQIQKHVPSNTAQIAPPVLGNRDNHMNGDF
jgi:hypothetical protein